MITQVPPHRTLVRSLVASTEPIPSADEPLLGEWLETDKAADTQRWVWTAEGEGVRHQQFAGVSAEGPMVECYATWDGRPWADPDGPALIGQLVQTWRVAPGLIIRLVLDNVAPPERLRWETFAVSADGETLATAAWPVDAPDRRQVRRFTKSGKATPREPRPARTSVPSPAVAGDEPLIGSWTADDEASKGRTTRATGEFRLGSSGIERRFQPTGDGLSHSEGEPSGTTFWRIDPRLYVQRVERADAGTMWAIHALSGDGKTLTTISWADDEPADAMVKTFTKSPARPDF